MYYKERSLKGVSAQVLLLATVCVLFLNGIASAHIFVLKPEVMLSEKGSTVAFLSGLAEPLVVLDMSRPMLEANGFSVNMDATVSYRSGLEKKLPPESFRVLDRRIPIASADAEIAQFVVEEKGTIVLHGNFLMERHGKKTVCFAKSLINLTDDGMSTKYFLRKGQSGLEIIFTDNVKSVKKGDALKIRAILKGKPLRNAAVSATFDGAPAIKEGEPENEYLTVKTNAFGEAAFSVDREGLWIVSMEHEDPLDNIRYRSSVLFKVD